MIKNVLFDLDDTLLDFLEAERVALEKALTQSGITPTPAITGRYSVINSEQWEKLEDGTLTREEVKLSRFQRLFQELGVDADPARCGKCYEQLLGVGHYWMPGAPQLLEALNGRYRLYLASNGTASVQHSRLASAGMEHYFEGIFISEEMGADKPSPEYFERCFAAIPDFRREETVMVGDRLTSDIVGGINAGIKTVWCNLRNGVNHTDLKPDGVVTHLNQLPALLERL